MCVRRVSKEVGGWVGVDNVGSGTLRSAKNGLPDDFVESFATKMAAAGRRRYSHRKKEVRVELCASDFVHPQSVGGW